MLGGGGEKGGERGEGAGGGWGMLLAWAAIMFATTAMLVVCASPGFRLQWFVALLCNRARDLTRVLCCATNQPRSRKDRILAASRSALKNTNVLLPSGRISFAKIDSGCLERGDDFLAGRLEGVAVRDDQGLRPGEQLGGDFACLVGES